MKHADEKRSAASARVATQTRASRKVQAKPLAGAWQLYRDDLRRARINVISLVIILGLVVIPAVFAWFNVAASWNPFGNTRNLTVAVANADTGYKSDLVPMKVNAGEQVVSALRANKQLNWEVTTPAQALEGTKSGKYYAAIVILLHQRKTQRYCPQDCRIWGAGGFHPGERSVHRNCGGGGAEPCPDSVHSAIHSRSYQRFKYRGGARGDTVYPLL